MKINRKALLMFLVPSLLGIFLFMIPIRHGEAGFFDPNGSFTIVVKVIADKLMNFIGYPRVSILCAIILSISSVDGSYWLDKTKVPNGK